MFDRCQNKDNVFKSRAVIYDPHIRWIKFRKLTYLICLVKFIQIIVQIKSLSTIIFNNFSFKNIIGLLLSLMLIIKDLLQVDKLLILSFQCKIGRVWKHMYLCRSSWCSPSHSYMCKYILCSGSYIYY